MCPTKTLMQTFMAVIFIIVKKWRKPSCPWASKLIKPNLSPHKGIWLHDKQGHSIDTYMLPRVSLKNLLGEGGQVQGPRECGFTYRTCPEKAGAQRQEGSGCLRRPDPKGSSRSMDNVLTWIVAVDARLSKLTKNHLIVHFKWADFK